MKTIEINRLSEINGGDVGDVVSGACAAVATASLFGVIALGSSPVGWTVGGVCLINAIGGGAGWW